MDGLSGSRRDCGGGATGAAAAAAAWQSSECHARQQPQSSRWLAAWDALNRTTLRRGGKSMRLSERGVPLLLALRGSVRESPMPRDSTRRASIPPIPSRPLPFRHPPPGLVPPALSRKPDADHRRRLQMPACEAYETLTPHSSLMGALTVAPCSGFLIFSHAFWLTGRGGKKASPVRHAARLGLVAYP
jgi:hypothetical protein